MDRQVRPSAGRMFPSGLWLVASGLLWLVASSAMAQTTTSAPSTRPSTAASHPPEVRAILIGATPGSPLYARRYQDWLKRFHAHLVKAGVPAANITVLTGDKTFKDPIVAGPATAESVCKAIVDIGGRGGANDQFVAVLVGHGSNADALPSVLLPGPDLTSEDFTKAMSSVTAGTQIVLNFTNASGGFLKASAAKGRISIASTSPEESAESVLAEFFLKALETGDADGEGSPGKAKDGQVSLLEAINGSSHQTALWISRQKRIPEDGTWQVTGKESVELFKKLYVGGENELGVRKLAEASDASAADAMVEIVPPKEAAAARAWGERRLVNEHATLDDRGQENGVCPLTAKGYEPITPAKPDSEGALAAKTVLGKLAAGEASK